MWDLFEKFRDICMKFITSTIPNLEGINQDMLVSMMVTKVDDVLFHPLQTNQRIEEDIVHLLEQAKMDFENLALQYIKQAGTTYYHSRFLEHYNISPPSAVAEVIWDEQLIETKYNFFLDNRSPADRAKIMKWEEYKNKIYLPLKRKIDLNFPPGLDRDFYAKRQLQKLQMQSQNIEEKAIEVEDIFAKNERLVKQQEAQQLQSPKVESIQKSPQPKQKSEIDRQTTLYGNSSEPRRDEENSVIEAKKSSQKNKKLDGERVKKTAQKNHTPDRLERNATKIEDPSKATIVPTIDEIEPEAINDSGSKLSLLERMRIEAESRQKSEKSNVAQGKVDVSYPPIFKHQGWRAYWSNSTAASQGEWNGWHWTCGSFSKDCVSGKISPKTVERGTDVNQDFLALYKSQRSLNILMFDGVSQSRAPRQWAECLAQSYAEKKLRVSELKKNGKRIADWQKNACERWERYIEHEYLPRRTHIPEWRLNNEVKTGHTTFVSVEIKEHNIRVANLGDSAVFILAKDSTLHHLPSTYNHLLRPSNISTDRGYHVEEMDFYEGRLDEIQMMLITTDSVADYIFGKDEELRSARFMDVLKNLSGMEHPLEYLRRMVDIGPAGGGLLEDDVSFFTLRKSIESQEEEE
jgi:serine/threonine protein phosphatase PrpC